MVGNGARLICCSLFFPSVALSIQGHQFKIPCYLLPIEGVDIMLGLDWLSTLGQISTDFATLCLSFSYHNQPITLLGNFPISLQPPSYHHLNHLSHTYSIASYHLISITRIPNTIKTNLTASLPPLPTLSTFHLKFRLSYSPY